MKTRQETRRSQDRRRITHLMAGGVLLLCVPVAWFVADAIFRGADWWPLTHEGTPTITTQSTVKAGFVMVQLFKQRKERYPKDLNELRAYIDNERGGHSDVPLFVDGWGNDLLYDPRTPVINPGAFDLWSRGANCRDDRMAPSRGDDVFALGDGTVLTGSENSESDGVVQQPEAESSP